MNAMTTIHTAMLLWLLAAGGGKEASVCGTPAIAYGSILQQWNQHGNSVVICGFKHSDLRSVALNTVEGGDMSVLLLRGRDRRVIASTDVFTPIRVSVDLPRITIMEFVTTGTAVPVPFVRSDLLLREGQPADIRSKLVFRGKPWRSERVGAIERALTERAFGGESDPMPLLYELRDMGINNPSEALRVFHRFDHAPWRDGDVGEQFSGLIQNLERARDVAHSPQAN